MIQVDYWPQFGVIHIDNSVKLVQCVDASGTNVINILGIDYAV